MSAEVVMPRMGATMTEGRVVRWLKQPGDLVQKDESLVEIETDKSLVEIPSPADGVLGGWLVEADSTVPIGTLLVNIASTSELSTKAGRLVPASEASADALEIKASPLAKRIARDAGIELATIQGTGPSGRIIEDDVRRAIEALQPAPPVPASPRQASSAALVESLGGVRRVAAERMTQSFTTAPHFYLQIEVDASALVAWQKSFAGVQGEHSKVTVTDLLLWVSAVSLRAHPRVNAFLRDDKIQIPSEINIGIAVGTDRGLVVPVLKQMTLLTLQTIAEQRADLVARARSGKLLPDEMAGGTFTLTNLGMFGIDSFQAILNPPQSAILAVGQIKERPFVVSGQLCVRPTLYLNLSADHRVLDGVDAAQFLGHLAELVETPQQMIA